MGRAEGEVSAFASSIALRRICDHTSRKKFFVATCKVVDGGDVGLGALRHAVRSDLDQVPSLLAVKAENKIGTSAFCAIDFGVAAMRALRAKNDIRSLITESDILKSYRPDADAFRDCNSGWTQFASASGHIKTAWKALRSSRSISDDEIISIEKGISNVLSPQAIKDLASLLTQMAAYEQGRAGKESLPDIARSTLRLLMSASCSPSGSALCKKDVHAAVTDVLTALLDRKYGDAIAILAASDMLGAIKNERTRKSLSLAADVATAQSSADLSGALQHLADPVGGWKRKHEYGFGVGIQGMVGVMGSWELPRADDFKDGVALAPTLSLGPEMYWSWDSIRLGVYAPVVDVGTVASVRLSDEDDAADLVDVETAPDAELVQLFAPGGHIYLSAGKSPVVLGAGFNYIPSLRKEQAGAGVSAAFRFGIYVAVDLSLLSIYSGTPN